MNLQSFFVLIFPEIQFEDNIRTTSTFNFQQTMIIITPVALTQFLEAKYTSIFKRIFITRFTNTMICNLLLAHCIFYNLYHFTSAFVSYEFDMGLVLCHELRLVIDYIFPSFYIYIFAFSFHLSRFYLYTRIKFIF